jgi:hypothetical protein
MTLGPTKTSPATLDYQDQFVRHIEFMKRDPLENLIQSGMNNAFS